MAIRLLPYRGYSEMLSEGKKAIMIQPLSHNFVAKSKTMKNLIDQTFLTAEAKTYKSLFSKFFNIIHIFFFFTNYKRQTVVIVWSDSSSC